MPLLVVGGRPALWRSLAAARDRAPFLLDLVLFGLTLAGLGDLDLAGRHPRPGHHLGGGGAAFEPGFMLVGAAILIPMILAYTAWSYWVFRGKVGEEGYH